MSELLGPDHDHELVIELDFCSINPRIGGDMDMLYLWCKEGWQRSVLGEFHTQKQALSRFFLGAIILTQPVLEVVRRELKRVSPDVKIEVDQIRAVLASEVIKREVMEGEKAIEASKKINKSLSAKNAEKAEKAAKKAEVASIPVLQEQVES